MAGSEALSGPALDSGPFLAFAGSAALVPRAAVAEEGKGP